MCSSDLEKNVGFAATMISDSSADHILPEMVMSTREVLGISAPPEGHVRDTFDTGGIETDNDIRCTTLTRIDSAVLTSNIGESIIVDDCAVATDINSDAMSATRIEITLLSSNISERIIDDDCPVATEGKKKAEFDVTLQLIASSLRVMGEPKRTSTQMSTSVSVSQFTKRRRSLRVSNPF